MAKWRRIAELTAARADGDLNATLEALPKAKAAALLKAYPGIGVPGADKIMLLAGLDVRPALDSNGLRTMLRLGFCAEGKSYPVSYRAAMDVLRAHGKATRAWFATAYRVLKAHGRALCKHGAPLCDGCPLSARCPKVSVKEP